MNLQNILDEIEVPDEELRIVLALLLDEFDFELVRGPKGNLFLNQIHKYE